MQSLHKNLHAIIYIEDRYYPEINQYIKQNYSSLSKSFHQIGIDFYYLPLLVNKKNYQAITRYNRPYWKNRLDKNTLEKFYDVFIAQKDIALKGAALIGITNLSIKDKIFPIEGTDKTKLKLCFSQAVDFFQNAINQSYLENSDIRFKIVNISESDDPFKGAVQHTCMDDSSDSYKDKPSTIDKIEQELQEIIDRYKETIPIEIINKIMEGIVSSKFSLSKLYITNDYKIFLKDYEMLEVEMSPLPKTLFFLYLKYPRGIAFKELVDYTDELLSIYKNISAYNDLEKIKQRIIDLTDPTKNTINENSSRIRSAFVKKINERIAQYYFITGARAEKKKIILDRTYVEFHEKANPYQ